MPSAPVSTFDFIVNCRSGTVLKTGKEKVRAEILSRFGDRAGTFSFVEGNEIASAVKAWVEEHAGGNRGLVIGGGDGTVIAAVEQTMGREDITLGTLPLGTQNTIAGLLGFPRNLEAAAALYKKVRVVEMDVSKVNGMAFMIGITLDPNSLNIFKAREDLRDKKLVSAFKKTFAGAAGFFAGKKKKFGVSTDSDGQNSKEIKGRFITITNNGFSPRAVNGFPFGTTRLKNIFARITAKEEEATGELSLYAFGGGLFKTAGLLPRLLNGTWNRSKAIRTESATRFIVQSGSAAEASISLDGEIRKVQYPLDVRIIPRGVRMYRAA